MVEPRAGPDREVRVVSAITLTLNPRDRLTLSTTIERLINMLDELEPDADLEDDADGEPSLGWTQRGPGALGSGRILEDLELDTADEESTATERHGMGFVASAPDDSEDTHDREYDPAEMGIADGGGMAEQCPGYGHGAVGYAI